MVEIDHKIIITSILCLTLIMMIMIIFDHDDTLVTSAIIGAISLMGGVLIKNPFQIDNNKGVLIW